MQLRKRGAEDEFLKKLAHSTLILVVGVTAFIVLSVIVR